MNEEIVEPGDRVSDHAAAAQAGRRHVYAAAALLTLATCAVYWNSLDAAFVFDDVHAIVENPHLLHVWPLSSSMSAPPQSSLSGRPIVAFSFALDHALTGPLPRSYRAGNILIHLIAGLLLFGIIRRSLELPSLAGRYRRSATLLAFAASLLWLVHPLQTESVTYVVQRSESLMGMFYLASVYCFARSVSGRSPVAWQAVSIVCCAGGMGCKEVMATAPLLIYAYDSVLASQSWRKPLRERWLYYAGLGSTWLILAALTISGPRSHSAGFSLEDMSPLRYAMTQPQVILHYIKLALWPRALCLDYGWRLAGGFDDAWMPIVVLLVMLSLVAVAAIRRPALGLVAGAFFLILAPTSSIVPIHDVAVEHRMYLPLACLCMISVLAADGAIRRAAQFRGWPPHVRARTVAGCSLLFAVALGLRTVQRNRDYATPDSMWRNVLAQRPDNPRAYTNLASHLLGNGKVDGAIEQLNIALRIYPEYSEALAAMALVHIKAGRFAEAAPFAESALRADESNWPNHNVLGILRARQRRLNEAAAHFQAAIRLNPDAADPHFNLACVFDKKSEGNRAAAMYLRALQLDPTHRMAHFNLAELFTRRGYPAEALPHYEAATRLDPAWPQAYNGLGNALARLDRLSEAAAAYREALRLDPRLAGAHLNVGNVLFRAGQLDAAAGEYRLAEAINPTLPTLAERLKAIEKARAATSRPS